MSAINRKGKARGTLVSNTNKKNGAGGNVIVGAQRFYRVGRNGQQALPHGFQLIASCQGGDFFRQGIAQQLLPGWRIGALYAARQVDIARATGERAHKVHHAVHHMPQARLQPSTATKAMRTSCWPALAMDMVPRMVMAMMRPKRISDVRSIGLRTSQFFGVISCVLMGVLKKYVWGK